MTLLLILLAANDSPRVVTLEARAGQNGLALHARLADPDGNHVRLETRDGARSHAVPSGFSASVAVSRPDVEVRAVDSNGAASPWVRVARPAPSPVVPLLLGFASMAVASLLFWRLS